MTATRLILCGLGLPFAAALAVWGLTAYWPGGILGYFAVLALYWAFYCIPVGLAAWREGGARATLAVGPHVWVPLLIVLQVAGLAAYFLFEGLAEVPWQWFAVGLVLALINAPLEELAWRGAYVSVAPKNPFVQTVGVWLFALWHVPLVFAAGVTFGASGFAIVAGSFALGSVWALAAFWTRSIGWPVLGHIGANALAFPPLLAANAAA